MGDDQNKVPSLIALTNVIAALESGSRLRALDPTSRAILKFVGLQNFRGQEVGASEILISLGSLASSVTLLNRISALDEEGWIRREKSVLHHRRKSILLTDEARAEIARLSNSLDAALQDLVSQK